MTQSKRLLISLAHPDDESFGLGGLIARYVNEGAEVYYLCATNGDVGTVSPNMLNGHNSIKDLRLAELECASKVLGFKKVFTLGYKDSGMMNSEHNHHEDALWYSWMQNPDHVLQKVTQIIREVRPQVVITFNRYGGYGHPDHIAIQQATTKAFETAGNPDYHLDGTIPYAPQKLYYSGIPSFFIRYAIWKTRLSGQNPRKVGRNKDIDFVKILENLEPAHIKINIRPFFETWQEASACHKSQGGGSQNQGLVVRWLRYFFGSKTPLTRIYPVPAHDHAKENDLFDGVDFTIADNRSESEHEQRRTTTQN